MPKKTGMKNARIRPRSCSSICLVRIGDSPISTPATKAPSTVCTPMKCVISAIPMITRMVVITGNSLSKLSLVQRIRKKTMRRPMVKLATRNTAVPSTLLATLARSIVPASARLKVMAMMIQPIVSSMIADATITCPRLRRVKFISRTIAATILIEEIDKAVPRNSDVSRRLLGSGSSDSGMNQTERDAAGERHRHPGQRNADGGAADLC